MRTVSLKLSKDDYEKLKCDKLHDYIMDFKEQKGVLPESLTLYSSIIPDECRKTMCLVVDDTIIPIIELSERPC
jgi:hypothetical protein